MLNDKNESNSSNNDNNVNISKDNVKFGSCVTFHGTIMSIHLLTYKISIFY